MNLAKNFLNKALYKLFLFFSVLTYPFVSLAQDVDGDLSGSSNTIHNPINVQNLNDFIKIVLEGIIKIAIPLIALALVYCGFLFVFARGKPKELETAKSSFIYTLIGAAILLGSWAIAQLISETVLQL